MWPSCCRYARVLFNLNNTGYSFMANKTLDSHQARNHWRQLFDAVLTDHTDVIITRYNKPVVTVIAYEDYLAVRDALAVRRQERETRNRLQKETSATMFASESVLAREWNTPEEDDAWSDL